MIRGSIWHDFQAASRQSVARQDGAVGSRRRSPLRPAPARLTGTGLVLVAVLGVLFTVSAAASSGAGGPGVRVAREARVIESDRTGVVAPVGLAFSARTESFYVVGAGSGTGSAETGVVRLDPFALLPATDRAGSARLAAALKDPVNMVFDGRRNRLLLLNDAGRLLEVRAGPNGDLDPSTLARRDAVRFGLRNPQGMAVDPASGVVFVLDAGPLRIVRIEPAADGSFGAATASEIDLGASGLTSARGIAFDPSTGHLLVRGGQQLVELTTGGAVVAIRDLSTLGLESPQAMVVAPSGDLTDTPGEMSLYVADSGQPVGSPKTAERSSAGATGGPGEIVEVSLAPQAAAGPITFTSTLINTVDMAALSPPSPDPSGITYLPPPLDRLMVSDGEVEETISGITHFQGANIWELTRSGGLLRTANISTVPPTAVPMTNEPTGVAFNPANGHYFFSDDGQRKVFELNPGADGLVGTAGDSWTSFDTSAVDNGDPEGVTYDTFGGHLFVADGVNREIYEYTTAGVLVNHFDTEQYGVSDPETVEFNSVSGTLFTMSDRNNSGPDAPLIIETTTGGGLLQTISASASQAFKPAGLAYAPASNGNGSKRFYVVDRGVDNNNDPNEVDGKMYELSAPIPGPPANLPPTVDAGPDVAATLPASASLSGSASDDGKPTPPSLTTTWSQVSGPSTVSFANPNAAVTTASVTVPGVYVVRLTASDGQFSASDDATLTFSGSATVQTLDVQVSFGADDAEENTSNAVLVGNADLDMMTDNEANLVVGTRFRGITIPKGTTISSAYLQFTADAAHSAPTTLTIRGEAADNAALFTSAAGSITSRPKTTASVSWSPPAWLAAGDTGLAQRTGNIAAVIQEIVNRPGWASGNALVLLVTGSGTRVAESYNKTGTPGGDPLLHVEWTTGGGNVAPTITSNGGGATAAVSVAENQTAVTDVDATDPDVGDTLTYSISGGPDAARFAINASSGVLTFVTAPNFEAPTDVGANNVYDVTVQVSDGHSGTDTQAIAVTVLNVNEFPPVITSNGGGATAAVSRPENQTAVTDVDATDGDGDPLTYSIIGGPDAARFAIVPSTGVLTFVTAPDFEAPTDVGANNVYDVVVEASDGSLTDTQAIAVTVTDVVEGGNSPPVITSNGGGASASVSVPENQVAVTDVDATDPNGDTLTYSISGGADAARFAIVPSTGVLTFVSAPDFEAPTDAGLNNVYDVIVQVSDGQGGLDTQAIAVSVTDVAEGSGPSLYFSLLNAATVGGVAVDDEDVVFFDGSGFSLAFDGSDVGLGGLRIDAFSWVDASTLLLSFDQPGSVAGISGTVDDSDIVQFNATSLGATTAGSFSLYFDGSDVGLTTGAEDVDAVRLLSNGHLLLSTLNTFAVTGASGDDKDLIEFTPTSLGANTAGSFLLYFDGSDVDLTTSGEDVDGATIDASGKIYLSTRGNFSVSGVSGKDEDVFVFTPTTLGTNTAGSYSSTLYFDGSAYGLASNDVTAIGLPVSGGGPGNQAPVVSAGPDQTITLPASATLDGTVTDDGLPGPSLTTIWSKQTGPGAVTFGDSTAIDTTASFSAAGTYVLRLTASDGERSGFDELTLTVDAAGGNQAPMVNAGPDQTITLPANATLDGTVSDDGLPTPPSLTTIWSKQTGPGTVIFGDSTAIDTTASFSAAGSYLLRLTASDGERSAFAELTVTVNPAGGGGQVFEVRVAATADDAEEVAGSGEMQRNSGDLNMMSDTSDTKQVVGLRFLGVAIPKGATITAAYVQFAAHKVNSEAASLTVRGQAADNPGTFLSANFDLSTRPTTSASAAWSPPAWPTVGEAGLAQRTSNIAAVVQEIVNRAGWSSGNSVVILVTGSGKRLATSYNNNPAVAAQLHVEWTP